MVKRKRARSADASPPEPVVPDPLEADQPTSPAVGGRVVITCGEHEGLEGSIADDFGSSLPDAAMQLADGSSVHARQFAIQLENGLLAFLDVDSLELVETETTTAR